MSGLLWIFVIGVLIAAAVYSLNLYSANQAVYPKELVDDLFLKRYPVDSISTREQPIAIVTGPTAGLGKGISEELFRLGFTVILASRNEKKYQAVLEEIKNSYSESTTTDKLICLPLDISDLDSVKKFSSQVIENYPSIDVLVNNAGIHYGSIGHLLNSSTPLTAQGFDLSFATNYLGHFLLTELLLPIFNNNGRILNVASTYHFQSDGTFLQPNNNKDITDSPHAPSTLQRTPIAALGGNHSFWRHRHLAYANSKLAQILHAKELQKRINAAAAHNQAITSADDANSNNINVNTIGDTTITSSSTTSISTATSTTENKKSPLIVSLCPAWVGTAITSSVPHISQYMYPVKAGILSPMCAILSTTLPTPVTTTGTSTDGSSTPHLTSHSQGVEEVQLQGGEFFTNVRIPLNRMEHQQPLAHFLTYLSSLKKFSNSQWNIVPTFRDILGDILAQVMLAVQGWDYGKCYVESSSIESYDEVLAKDLYDWTKDMLIERGYMTK